MSYRYRSKRLKRVKKQTGGEMSGADSKGWADAKSNISWASKKRRQNLSGRVARLDRAAC